MSTKKLIIFGLGPTADVLHYFFDRHSDYEVICFTVDKKYCSTNMFNGLPVIPFEELEEKYSPNSHTIFVAMGYGRLNMHRGNKLKEVKEKGYKTTSFIHPNSGVPDDLIVGDNCFIMHNVHIHPRVKIGDNVFIWSGTVISHHSTVGSHCWFTSGVSVAGNVTIGDHCFFAVNSTVTNDVTIGNQCILGANSLVNYNLEDEKVVLTAGTKVYPLSSSQFLDFKNDRI